MARVILSQYIALMELYQAQLRAELNLLKDISEFEDFDNFEYQQKVVLRMLKEDIYNKLSRMAEENDIATDNIEDLIEKEGAKNEN